MFRPRDLATLAVCVFASAAFAGPPRLVRDINPTIIPVNSTPGGFLDQGAWSMFDAINSTGYPEPWATDGTSAGTVRLGSVNPFLGFVTQYQTQRAGGFTYFFFPGANQGRTSALYRSDGTAAGTTLVRDLSETAEFGNIWGAVGSVIFFTVWEPGQGPRLWRSDGTDAGTFSLTDSPTPGLLFYSRLVTNDRLYFVVNGGGHQFEPWISDGTVSGTRRIAQIPNVTDTPISISMMRSGPYILVNLTTTTAGSELWRIDVVTEAIAQVVDIAPGPDSGISRDHFGTVNDVALFKASNSSTGPQSLWRSDGTAGGTYQVANVEPQSDIPRFEGPTSANRVLFRVINGANVQVWSTDGATASPLAPLQGGWIVGRANGLVYLLAGNGELWRTDGTLANTRPLTGLPGNLTNVEITGGGSQLFVRGYQTQWTNWRYDLATDTAILLRSHGPSPGGIGPMVFSYAQGRLYFDSIHPVTGHELWISDGTPEGTRLLRNIAPETRTQASEPKHLFEFNGVLYFSADDGVVGRELWRSDGTPGGTQLVIDLAPGTPTSDPHGFFEFENQLYFFAYDGQNRSTFRLYRTDGTAAGTHAIVAAVERSALFGGQGPCGANTVTVGGNAYLSLYELGSTPRISRTNGTAAGTVRIVDNAVVPIDDPCQLTALNGRVYFTARQFSTVGEELWSLVPGGTPQLVADIWPGVGSSSIREMLAFGGNLYFFATNAPNVEELWRSDGTAAGTTAISTSSFAPNNLRVAADRLFFLQTQSFGVQGAALMSSDGSAAGTLPVGTVRAHGPLHSDGARVFFNVVAFAPMGTSRPWASDGTTAGTYALAEPASGLLSHFWDFHGSTVIQMIRPGNVSQMWRTDGTVAGTALLGDAGVVPTAVYPVTHRAAGRSFFYSADDDGTGLELYAVDNEAPVVADDAPASVSAGQPLAIAVLGNDTDTDGRLNPSSVNIATQPANGAVVVGANGVVTYTPNPGFSGTDQFSYTVADSQGARSPSAIVRITVTAAPVVVAPPAPPPAPPAASGGKSGGGSLGMLELLIGMLLVIRLLRISGSGSCRGATPRPSRHC